MLRPVVGGEDPLYARRRIDALTDKRLEGIESEQKDTNEKLADLEDKVDELGGRLNYLVGGLAVLTFLLNFLAPIILDALTRRSVP